MSEMLARTGRGVRAQGTRLLAAGLLLAVLAVATHGADTQDASAAFLAECHAAMKKMMSGMEVKPSGDVDRDFAAMMIPHHKGAIDMAQSELRYGRNERLRRLAQEIIVEQTQEIEVMRLAIGPEPSPSPGASK
jgi:uncharacterized protein (DUF305 family)